MTGDRVPTAILSVQIISNADPALLEKLAAAPGHRSLGLITTDCDDVSYAALDAAIDFCENVATFYSANDEGSVVYFAHCISRTGSYLSKQAKVPEGTPMAYLIAPPLEATLGLDAALKAAEVEMKVFYGPPTETNFAGGLLVGDQAACRAACEAFAGTVCEIAGDPTGF